MLENPADLINVLYWGSLIVGLLCLYGFLRLVRKQHHWKPRNIKSVIGMFIFFGIAGFSFFVFVEIHQIRSEFAALSQALDEPLDQPAPELEFTGLDGESVFELQDFRGDVVLLNFWATWCAPYIKELPDLAKLQEKYEDAGLRVVTISDENRIQVLNFSENIPVPGTAGIIDSRQEMEEPFRHMRQIRPLSFVIDRDGILRYSIPGVRSFEAFEKLVTPYLQE